MYVKKLFFANKSYIFILFFIIFLFCVKTNFFKNTFLLISSNYEDRIIKSYGFCSKSAVGYIVYLKKKYNIIKSPKIISYAKSPKLYWLFNDMNPKDETHLIILFNKEDDGNTRFNTNGYRIIDNYKNDCLFLKKI